MYFRKWAYNFVANANKNQCSMPHDWHYDAGEGTDITYRSIDFILGVRFGSCRSSKAKVTPGR